MVSVIFHVLRDVSLKVMARAERNRGLPVPFRPAASPTLLRWRQSDRGTGKQGRVIVDGPSEG